MVPVSVIIPVRNEEALLPSAVRSAREAGADEVVVVDGQSADRTVAVARGCADTVLSCVPLRGRQLNEGAAAARGEILVFLHADTALPPGGADAVREAVRSGATGGAFLVALAASGGSSRLRRAGLALVARMIGARAGLFRSYTGDQAIFATREAFARLGGFREFPLMEDVDFSRRMRRAGRTILLRQRVATSARRWEAGGIARTTVRMWALRLAWMLGASPERLARAYRGRGREKDPPTAPR